MKKILAVMISLLCLLSATPALAEPPVPPTSQQMKEIYKQKDEWEKSDKKLEGIKFDLSGDQVTAIDERTHEYIRLGDAAQQKIQDATSSSKPQETPEEDSDTTLANEKDAKVSSWQKDLFMGIWQKQISDGAELLTSDKELEDRQKLNYNILTGQQSEVVSLFDRFGGDILFPMYTGEERITTGVADKIYTNVKQNAEGDWLIESVIDLFSTDESSFVGNYYNGRPALKTEKELDPRVAAYSPTPIAATFTRNSANYLFSTGKIITNAVTILTANKLATLVCDSIEEWLAPTSELRESIARTTRSLMPVFIIFFMFFIVRAAWGWLRTGSQSLLKVLLDVFGAFISIGLVFTIIANPMSFVNISRAFVTFTENITAEAIKATNKDDEIIYSSNNNNVIEATLWEEAIFKPWINGIFEGVDYENLYTTFSNKPTEQQWQLSQTAANDIGNIVVYRSSTGTDDVQNWGALAYSCSSFFHIDATAKPQIDIAKEGKDAWMMWPRATIVGTSEIIYQDDFRWIDASLKVGQYDENDEKAEFLSSPYQNFRSYTLEYYDGAAKRAIWLSILLIPLGLVGLKKVWNQLLLIFNFATMLVRSCVNIAKPDDDQYNTLGNLKVAFTPLINLLYYSIILAALIVLYKSIGVSPNIWVQLVYFVVAIYIARLKPQTLVDKGKGFRDSIKSGVINANNRIKTAQTFNVRAAAASLPDSVKQAAADKAQEEKEIERQEESEEEGAYDSKIDIELYFKAESECLKHNDKTSANRYSILVSEIRTAEKYRDLYRVIDGWRNSRGKYAYGYNSHDHDENDNESKGVRSGRELDLEYLGISANADVPKEWKDSETRSKYFDYAESVKNAQNKSFNSQESQLIAARTEKLQQEIAGLNAGIDLESGETWEYKNKRKDGESDDEYGHRTEENDKAREKQIKKAKKEAKSIRKRQMANAVQEHANAIFGIKGGNIIPPIWKFYILIGFIVAYLVGWLIYTLIG